MKLAEALLERKELKTKVENLRARAVQNALVQEGDAPAEAPTELLREMNEAIEQLGVLIRRINATNNVTHLPNGTTISDAIVQRDMLELRRLALDVVLNKAAVRQERFARNEIKFVPPIDAAAIGAGRDAVALARRVLGKHIQAV